VSDDLQQSGLYANGMAQFHDPFLSESVIFQPDNIGTDVWDMCLFLYVRNQEFINGFRRVIDFHLTDIDFYGDKTGDKKEQAELKEWLMDGIKIFDFLKKVGLEYAVYGNSFPIRNPAFTRFLMDTRFGRTSRWEIAMCEKLGPVKFLHQECKYEVVDPLDADKAVSKRKRIKLSPRDLVNKDPSRLSFDTMNIRDVICNIAPMGGGRRIIRRFHPSFYQPLETKDPFFASTVPLEFLRASAKREDWVYDPEHVRHFMAPTINGIRNLAFGIPETMLNFSNIYHLQVLKRTNQAVGQDFVIPMRVMSPAMSDGQEYSPNMRVWKEEMRQVIKNHRHNPYAIHASQYPISMADLSANTKQFVPADIMQWHTENLFDCLNIPVELYKGKLEQEMVPVALRLFASGWTWMYRGFNDILRWAVSWYYKDRNEDPPKIRLTPSRIADNMDRRQYLVQLVAAGEISRKTGFAAFDIDDPGREAEDRMDEDIDRARKQQKAEAEYQQEQELGALAQQDQQGGAQGGAYGGAPSGVAITPADQQGKADELAQQWLGMPHGEMLKDMARVRNTDQTLYALAMQAKKKLEQQGASQGKQMLQQQAQQQIGGAPPAQ